MVAGNSDPVSKASSVKRAQAQDARGAGQWKRDKLVGFLVFLPTVLIMLAIIVYPVLRIGFLALHRVDVFITHQEFVGLHNILFVLQWGEFWSALWNDVVFTGGSIIIQIVIGVAMSLFLNREFMGRNPARSVILFSYLMPVVVAALIWRFMLNDSVGIVNYVIDSLNLPIPTTWFASPKTAMASVIAVNVWKFFPFMVIVFLAQLQSIDPSMYEAAKVDGASRWQEFYHITLPCLQPVIIIAAMLRTIWHFNDFAVVNLLTGGGPLGSTQTPPVLIYEVVFQQFNLGRGSAVAIIMFFILVVMSLVYLKLYNWAEDRLT